MKIPIRKRGGQIHGYALVDPEDFGWANNFKWTKTAKGYPYRWVKQSEEKPYKTVYLHREVMGFQSGDGRVVDHINRDRFDNRRANLRETTLAENNQNIGSHRGSSSNHRGVSWAAREQKWLAQGKVAGRRVFLGYFDDERNAAAAARQYRAESMPYATD